MATTMWGERKSRLCLFAVIVACLVPFLSAVIVEEREYHGKKVSCLHGGLVGVAKGCGTEGYAQVFTGTVKSATDVGETDKRLQIIPDEIFLGDSAKEVTAIANQACLRSEIQAGDKWLFYLYRDPKSETLVLPYDSPSKPVVMRAKALSVYARHMTASAARAHGTARTKHHDACTNGLRLVQEQHSTGACKEALAWGRLNTGG